VDWWVDVLKGWITPFLAGVVTVGGGFKIFLGRRAKEADLFDRITKEIAVRGALLQLKLSALAGSELNDPKQVSAKEVTYQQAKDLEERLNKELERLAPITRPEELWWRQTSTINRLFPEHSERDRKKQLDTGSKFKWWLFISLFYGALAVYLLFAGLFTYLIVHTKAGSLSKSDLHTYTVLLVLLAIIAPASLWFSTAFRRDAYAISLRQKPGP
jgi:hypothetical protein